MLTSSTLRGRVMLTVITSGVTKMLKQLWRSSKPLTLTGLVMIPLLGAAIIGLMLDPRQIAGAPAWLKPAKFSISIAIYTFTLAWIFSRIPEWVRTRRVVGWTT